jgi:hypothetical protein
VSRPVHLHVGVAKSGTTYLQGILFDNKALLAENGVLYPGTRRGDHFLASMDLRESGFAGHDYPRAQGMWRRLVDEANAFAGATVISHETLARTPRNLVRTAVDAFDSDDVRVVVTARDLARQIPAVWQEGVKNRLEGGYRDFLDGILRSEQGRERVGGFWQPQYLPGVVERWADVVGADNVTVVTVPPPGADKQELWNRFSLALGLPPLTYVFPESGGNPSLGVVESELLRRLNGKLPDIGWPEYEARIKKRFAERTLVTFSGSARLQVPDDYRDEVAAVGVEIVEALAASGCRVVGDLEELRPQFGEGGAQNPDDVAEDVLLDLALGLVGHYASRPGPRPMHGQSLARRAARRLPPRVRERIARFRR